MPSFVKCCTEKAQSEEYIFYMRQLQRNIVYCHQKYKAKRKGTLSETKSAPMVFGSTKQTAIEFEQIGSPHKNSVSIKESNGISLYHLIEQQRKQKNDKQLRIMSSKIKSELDQKLLDLNKSIQEKKQKKKKMEESMRQPDKNKKENRYFQKYFKLKEKQMSMAFATSKKHSDPDFSPFTSQDVDTKVFGLRAMFSWKKIDGHPCPGQKRNLKGLNSYFP